MVKCKEEGKRPKASRNIWENRETRWEKIVVKTFIKTKTNERIWK